MNLTSMVPENDFVEDRGDTNSVGSQFPTLSPNRDSNVRINLYPDILKEIALRENQKRKLIETNEDKVSRRKNKKPKKIMIETASSESLQVSCLLCEIVFVSKGHLLKHLQEIHELNPRQIFNRIEIDELYFSKLLEIERGSSILFTKSKDSCQICNWEFKDQSGLRLHLRVMHPRYASIACGICVQLNESWEQLQHHIATEHSINNRLDCRRFYCDICWQQSDLKEILYEHVFIHEFMIEAYIKSGLEFDPNNFIKENNFGDNSSTFDSDDATERDTSIHKFGDAKSDEEIDEISINDENDDGNQNITNFEDDPTEIENQNLQKIPRNYSLTYGCEWCSRTLPSKWDRWLHVALDHISQIPTLRCTILNCSKIFVTERLRIEHEQHHQLQGAIPNSCEICCKLWNTRVDFYKHMMGVHPQAVPLVCGVCLKIFPRVNDLCEHVQSQHVPLQGEFVCNICGRNYANKSKMLRHRRIHGLNEIGEMGSLSESETEFVNHDLNCNECPDLIFKTCDELNSHKRGIHQIFQCDLCPKSYGRNSHLWKHVNRCHKGNKLITCQICFKTSASKYHLQQHVSKIHTLKSESTPATFLDKKCNSYSFESVKQSFLRQELLDKEQSIYEPNIEPEEVDMSNYKTLVNIITNYDPPTSNGTYKCSKCYKLFSRPHILKKHKKNCQPRTQKDFLTRCKTCERIFKDRQSLQKHLANYHADFKCHICEITFPSKCEIISHIRFTHPTHEDFVCKCGQILRCKEDLVKHEQDHRNSHICQFCGDSLLTKMALKMHILSLHRKILSLSCGICLKLFTSQHVLRDHVKSIHFRNTSFGTSCPVCGKKYGSKWKCFYHINKSHGKVFKPCKVCLSIFENEEQVREHFCNVHLDKSNSNQISRPPLQPIVSPPTLNNQLSFDYHESNQNDSPNLTYLTTSNFTLKPFFDNNSQIVHRNQTPQVKRTVYENSDTPTMCEVCLKIWPAKKHLWQHYIRCHKLEAATVCGICLKTHSNYLDLRNHLYEQHPTLLHGRGLSSNFICKICGRYHNASSKLRLHMLIHVNYNLNDDYDYVKPKESEKKVNSEIPKIVKDSFKGFTLDERKFSQNYWDCYKQRLTDIEGKVVPQNESVITVESKVEEIVPPKHVVDECVPTSFIVLKFDDGREVRYDNIQITEGNEKVEIIEDISKYSQKVLIKSPRTGEYTYVDNNMGDTECDVSDYEDY